MRLLVAKTSQREVRALGAEAREAANDETAAFVPVSEHDMRGRSCPPCHHECSHDRICPARTNPTN